MALVNYLFRWQTHSHRISINRLSLTCVVLNKPHYLRHHIFDNPELLNSMHVNVEEISKACQVADDQL